MILEVESIEMVSVGQQGCGKSEWAQLLQMLVLRANVKCAPRRCCRNLAVRLIPSGR